MHPRGRRITSITAFLSVDHDGDEAIAHVGDGLMLAVHDRARLMQLRELMHSVAVTHGQHLREVVFVRASGKRFHIEHDAPDDPPWYRGTEYQLLDLHYHECDDADCQRRHVYLNYAANRAQDAARARKLRRRR